MSSTKQALVDLLEILEQGDYYHSYRHYRMHPELTDILHPLDDDGEMDGAYIVDPSLFERLRLVSILLAPLGDRWAVYYPQSLKTFRTYDEAMTHAIEAASKKRFPAFEIRNLDRGLDDPAIRDLIRNAVFIPL